MGPKKKRRTIARQHITEKFSPLPSDGICCNEHVLSIYIKNDSSAAKTIRAVDDRFGFRPAYSQIETLVARSIEKFKWLSREGEQQRFDGTCQEVFHSRVDPPAAAPESESTPVHPESSLPPSSFN